MYGWQQTAGSKCPRHLVGTRQAVLLILTSCMLGVAVMAVPAFAVGPFLNAPYVEGYAGYASWDFARDLSAETSPTPHGNYTTSTNKCAVCHSVHGARQGGVALTPIVGQLENATEGCLFCHAPTATLSGIHIVSEHDGSHTVSPHTLCETCHVRSPHGADASTYPLLAHYLLPDAVDPALDHDLSDYSINNLSSEMFDMSDPDLFRQGMTVATGYVCSYCHDEGGVVAFAVNRSRAQPYSLASGMPAALTGHRAYAMDTDTWNEAGEHGVVYEGATTSPGDSRVAYRAATGCVACHDAVSASGTIAFPHGYVDQAGLAVSAAAADAALLWLTTSAHSEDTALVLAQGGSVTNDLVTRDGLCLKCHMSDDSGGVGLSY